MSFKTLRASAAVQHRRQNYLLGGSDEGPPTPTVFTLTFEGCGDEANILNFYNGGTDSFGNSGTNYGVEFLANALSVRESNALSNFSLEPSFQTVMFFLDNSFVTLNMAAGFTTGFSFYYSSVSFSGTVSVYDGVDATGAVLATLPITALGIGPVPGKPFSNWQLSGVLFSGVAKSIAFAGTANQVAFDNISFGGIVP